MTPGNLNYVKPLSGGSEAAEAAMKFVRQFYKQTGCPGKTSSSAATTAITAALSGHGSERQRLAQIQVRPADAGIPQGVPALALSRPIRTWEDANRFAAESVEEVILQEGPETVAGVILEPIGNTGGIITPTREYFQILRAICDRYNVALIFDEVITGFAKTGRMFAGRRTTLRRT